MRTLFVAMSLCAFATGAALAQTGADPQVGKTLWSNPLFCKNCHGTNGEGGYGPDLAGRQLTASQFMTAVRKPWGAMPSFTAAQVSDKELADVQAYLGSLPSVDKLGSPRYETPAGAPRGQQIVIAGAGCGQCHGPVLGGPRASIGGTDANFEWFKRMVYDHPAAMADEAKLTGSQPPQRLRMGAYSPARLSESELREIWSWARALGFRPDISSRFDASSSVADGVKYPFEVANNGLLRKGLTARDLTISLQLPLGAKIVSATGVGYAGVRHDETLKADVAEWNVTKLAPMEHQSFSLTTTGAGAVKGVVQWKKPAVKTGPSDSANIGPAPSGPLR